MFLLGLTSRPPDLTFRGRGPQKVKCQFGGFPRKVKHKSQYLLSPTIVLTTYLKQTFRFLPAIITGISVTTDELQRDTILRNLIFSSTALKVALTRFFDHIQHVCAPETNKCMIKYTKLHIWGHSVSSLPQSVTALLHAVDTQFPTATKGHIQGSAAHAVGVHSLYYLVSRWSVFVQLRSSQGSGWPATPACVEAFIHRWLYGQPNDE